MMSMQNDTESTVSSRRTGRAVMITVVALAAALLLLILLHSAIPPPEIIKSRDLWERDDRWRRVELDIAAFGLGHDPHFGWVGWWPVYRCEGAHDIIFVRHGLYLTEYDRAFSVDLPRPEKGWPEVVETDRP